MKQEPADELVGGNSHRAGLVGIARPILLVLKSHLAVADVQYPPVVEGHAVRITAEVFQHPVRSAEGGFAVNDPIDPSERCGQREESGRLFQILDLSGKARKVFPESVFERFGKEPSKRQDNTRTGRKKPGFEETRRLPSRLMPPPVATQ
ncbi:MAG TPA: hypothetical protein VFC21_02535 [Bryobacteraceae bacterium]|nr:hypothetical protein [Bryobacteraceae bacterium]